MSTKHQSQLKLTDSIMRKIKIPALDGNLKLSDLEEEKTSDNESPQNYQSKSEDELQSSPCNASSLPLEESACSAVCCTDLSKVYQPTSKETTESLFNQRKFRPEWFKQYSWLTACLTKKKNFFAYLADTFF